MNESTHAMTRDELQTIVLDAIGRLAPEADLASLDPDADLREALDLDSMDFLSLVVSLNERLHVEVPERDYRRILTLRGCVDYLIERGAAR
jgi:acyl carrier protein